MIALDTDILAIHHIFTWDPRRSVNEQFYQRVKGNTATSIHNLLELCGLFSLAGLSQKADSVLEKYLKGREVDRFGQAPATAAPSLGGHPRRMQGRVLKSSLL